MRTSLILAVLAAVWTHAASAQTPSYLLQSETVARSSSWTGPWVGLFVGGGVLQQSSPHAMLEVDPAAFIVGGAELGYDFQFQRVVVGLNASIYGSTAPRTDVAFDIGLRAGILATPDLLLYATGGVSSGKQRAFFDIAAAGPFGPVVITRYPLDATQRLGFFVGAGAEYKFTPSWSGAVEYRYADYGVDGRTIQAFFNSSVTLRLSSRHHSTRFALRYRF